jgi:hypothetical protein
MSSQYAAASGFQRFHLSHPSRTLMEYRTNNDPKDDSWHFCQQCSKWPRRRRGNILWLANPPRHLKLCAECQRLTSMVVITTPKSPSGFVRPAKH